MVILDQKTMCLCRWTILLHHQRNRTNWMSFLDPLRMTLQRDIQEDRCLHQSEMLRLGRQNDFAAFVLVVSGECQDHTPTHVKTCLYDGGVSKPLVGFLSGPPLKPIGF